MSEDNMKAALDAQMQKAVEIETLQKDTQHKRAILDNKRVNTQFSQLEQNEKDLAIAQSTNFGAMTANQIAKIQKENDEYLEAAKAAMYFINESFRSIVPFFRKNFIFIGGKTGDGKSTTVANIVHSVITQKNPLTGKTRRALVITNEERAEDFYNRVTCLVNGWHYTNHDKFTQEQKDTFKKFIPLLASNGRLTVVDNTHNDSHGVTTTIEGIETIFENLLRNEEYYDVILIDYYQNIITSAKNPYMSENEVQSRLSRMMDKYKNLYPAPIVMMGQVNAPDKDNKIPFQQRIKGRKIIMDPATCVIEMVADRKNLRTVWTIWKSRFTEAVGQDFKTGYDRGKFVEYTNEFAERVQRMAYEKEARKINETIDKSNGIPEVFEKNKEKEEVNG